MGPKGIVGSVTVQKVVWVPALAVLAVWCLASGSIAQPLSDDIPDRVVVPVPRPIAKALDEAEAALAAGQHHAAIKLLQSVLDNPEDYFLDEKCRSSVKRRAGDLLRGLPTAGRQAYDLEWGSAAAAVLERSRSSGDNALLYDLIRRHGLTPAAAEARKLLAAQAFDSGDFLTAALLWEELQAQQPEMLSSADRVQLAAAWHLTQHSRQGEKLLRDLQGTTVRLNGLDLALPAADIQPWDWLEARYGARNQGQPLPVSEWAEIRGGGTRHASALPTGPVGGPLWRTPVLAGDLRGNPPQLSEYVDLRDELEAEIRRWAADDRLTIPVAMPLAIADLVVFRTLDGLAAVDRRTGQFKWRAALSDPQLERQRQAVARLQQRDLSNQLPNQASRTKPLLHELIFRDATRGTLSSDGKWVFAVEAVDQSLTGMSEAQQIVFRNVPNPPSPVNKLAVYELSGGRLVAEIGGRREEPALPLGGVFFFGPPLVHQGRLYCLAELSRELMLLQLRLTDERTPRVLLEWSQPLTAPERLLADASLRRMAGLTPSATGPLVICPTAAGMVAAVDVLHQQLRWGYQYDSLEAMRTTSPRQQILFRVPNRAHEIDEDSGRWLESTPIVIGSRVLVTPRDSAELHCLDLLEGTLLWKRPRGQGLFIAGAVDDQIVVIQRNAMEAFRLTDGQPVWTSPVLIPPPAGRGILLEDRYVLPLSTGEIATIDLRRGRILARSRVLEGQTAGNLAASGGALVSQSAFDLLGFRAEPEIEAEAAARLSKNPRDPQALSWRGELRLHRGDIEAGLSDLRASQQIEPSPRTTAALAAALLQALRSDFAGHRDVARELDQLPLERSQKLEFLRLLADALTQEGRRLDAQRQYLRLMELTESDPPWERVEDLLTARSDRVIHGRIQTLYQGAAVAEREQLEAEAYRQILESKNSSPETDRQFLRLFAQHPVAGAVWRRVVEHDLQHDRPRAERLLLELADASDPTVSAFATAKLAELFREKYPAATARFWLKRLNEQFSAAPVADSRTGRELLQQWDVDLSQLQANVLDQWPRGPADVEHKKRLQTARRIRYAEVFGTLDTRFDGWSFEVQDDAEQLLIARDRAGRTQWRAVVPVHADDQQVRYAAQMATPRVFACGPWLALSLGTKFVVWDVPAEADAVPRFCWQHSLTPPGLAGVAALALRPEILPNGRRRLRNVDVNGMEPPGQLVGLTPRDVIFQMGDRLQSADPATGALQWVRQGVPRQCEVTGNAAIVALYESSSGEARLYRTTDGVEVVRRNVGSSTDWLWFQGERLLTLSRLGNQQRLSMQSLLRDQQLWERDLDLLARCRVVDDRELLVLHPSGTLQCLSLEQGRTLWEASLPALEALDYLWARRVDNRYELVIRQPTPATGARRVISFDVNQIAFFGKAAAVEGQTGRVLWLRDVGPTAFDVIQPACAPVLPFAARVDPPPHLARNELPPMPGLSATFLDARTGEVLYQTWETAVPNMYQMELSGERGEVVVNFHSWMLVFNFSPTAENPAPKTQD